MGIFNKADILLPSKEIDLTKWSVVACDQYTSQPEYWEETKNIVGDAPSTLNIVFPEVYLGEGEGRISKINAKMQKYLEDGVFDEYKNILIYVERLQGDGRIRRGIIGTVDLDEYDFSKSSKSLIRATEGTVLERIPPRVKIRENAPLELPHILILLNDETDEVIKKPENCEKLYDFELMQKGGHIKGYKISDGDADKIIGKINEMAETAYGNLLFAVGDGNHSLATAKTCWENLKKTLSPEEQKRHPARYCLVEIENIHQEAIDFEPIHRVVFGVNPQRMIDEIKEYYPETSEVDNGGQHIKYVFGSIEGDLYIKNSASELAVGTLQKFLDSKEYKIDYIHGNDTAKTLAKNDNNIAFLLPKPDKNDLFKAVIKDGALPRKTFSMGEANDKRFYFEAKRIK